ncbi:hypothetical protein CTTA_3423 [Comamonas testosteroni]|uniref:Uncharacterized protein n=1 Tax=Comamonas testosteroni TaxID=285 RepID=A0A5A7MEY7_COMTE|nr:hypothetical protein CTTA_3423 [Comamonas testosteroni]
MQDIVVRQHREPAAQALGKGSQVTLHLHETSHASLHMLKHDFSGGGRYDATCVADKKRRAQRLFKRLDPEAGRRGGEMASGSATRHIPFLANRMEHSQISQFVAHCLFAIVKSQVWLH